MKFPTREEEKQKKEAKLEAQMERLKLFDECDTWAEFRMKEAVKGTCPKRDWLDPFWWHYSMNESKPLNRIRNFVKVGFVASLLLLVVTAASDAFKVPAICFFGLMFVLEGLDIALEVFVTGKILEYRDAYLDKTLRGAAKPSSQPAAPAPLFSVTTTTTTAPDGSNAAATPPAEPGTTTMYTASEAEGAGK